MFNPLASGFMSLRRSRLAGSKKALEWTDCQRALPSLAYCASCARTLRQREMEFSHIGKRSACSGLSKATRINWQGIRDDLTTQPMHAEPKPSVALQDQISSYSRPPLLPFRIPSRTQRKSLLTLPKNPAVDPARHAQHQRAGIEVEIVNHIA